MGRDKKNEARTGQFTKWIRSEVGLDAWKALSPSAQAAYPHVRVRCFAEAKDLRKNNNGRVILSTRTLAKEMGCVPKTAASALADLQAKGWIVCTNRAYLGLEGKGVSPEWRLTMLETEDRGKRVAPTYDPKRWQKGQDFEVIECAKSKRSGHKPGDANRFKGSERSSSSVIDIRRRPK